MRERNFLLLLLSRTLKQNGWALHSSPNTRESGFIHVTHLHVYHHVRHPAQGGEEVIVILLMTPPKYRLHLRQAQMCQAKVRGRSALENVTHYV